MLELMITLTVASILLSMAAPNMIEFIRSQSMTTQANEMVATLSHVRSEAIRRNTAITFCRIASKEASTCASGDVPWQYWMAITHGHTQRTVISRGEVSSMGGMKQTANFNSVIFGADGITRVNGRVVNNHFIQIRAGDKSRCLSLGPGSRYSVSTVEGNCQ